MTGAEIKEDDDDRVANGLELTQDMWASTKKFGT